jgi:catechol 2,3-dioxygenase-like lactoylglutathione lyase family enzyme
MSAFNMKSFHTVLVCREWDACVSFYRDILRFEAVDSREGFVEVRVHPGAYIGLIRQKTAEDPGTPDTRIILSFRVEDLDTIHEILRERRINVTGIQLHPWGARLFELRDPEGRRLEFWTPNS